MDCSYFDARVCRSCTLMGVPYGDQLARKDSHARDLLDPYGDAAWLPPVASVESGYRNKAKMVVSGTVNAPTIGILDEAGRGVDLRACGICAPEVRAALPVLADFVTRTRIEPYSVPERRGELKYVLVTHSPDDELMVRFVVRTDAAVERIRARLDELLGALPTAVVVTANLQPEHKAVVEGDTEIVLTPQSSLVMRVGGIPLRLRPQSFFQTNTAVAESLYAQVTEWVDRVSPSSVWDLVLRRRRLRPQRRSARATRRRRRDQHGGRAQRSRDCGGRRAPSRGVPGGGRHRVRARREDGSRARDREPTTARDRGGALRLA